MNAQLTLNARSTDPVTSHAAAERAGLSARTRSERILNALQIFSEGLTTVDIAELLAERLVCVSPCMVKLELAGKVYRDGKRRSGITNCERIVWKALADAPGNTLSA